MATNRRWTHRIPGVHGLRVNTLLVVPGTEAADWREGQIRLDQNVGGDLTQVTFLILWVYPFWIRWILTKVNAHAQGRAQTWAQEHAPAMLMTDNE